MLTMPAVTILQPYASLIAQGDKPFETRSFDAPSLVGRSIAIHAATRPMKGERLALALETIEDDPENLPLGKVICLARVSWCQRIVARTDHTFTVANGDSFGADEYGDYAVGRSVWRLDDIRPLTVPIACKGQLGIWHWPVPRTPLA